MSIFLGCDVAKLKLDLSLIDGQGKELWIDKVANEELAIATKLLTIAGAYPDEKLICVVESTATLHLTLAETAYALGVVCLVYNPIKTKSQIKASVRGKKTDRTDALHIARVGLMGEIRPYVPEVYRAVKYYARGQQKLSQMSNDLSRYEAHINNLLEDEMTQAAKDMLAGIQASFKAARKQFIDDTAASTPEGLMTLLRSIPGVGPFIAASLIGEIQDIKRFKSSKSLIAYAGLDAKIRQSADNKYSGSLTKRGSTYLRRTIFIAANVARRYDPNFEAIYKKKRDEGKRHTEANIVVFRY